MSLKIFINIFYTEIYAFYLLRRNYMGKQVTYFMIKIIILLILIL